MYTLEQLEKAYNEACEGINIDRNQEIIIASNDIMYAYYFAKDVKNADVEKLQQIIIDNKDYKYAYLFALKVKEADIQKLSEVFLNSGDEYWIKKFYECIPHDKFDTSRFETYLTFM